ncbi:MAG: hypothetical protein LAT77_07800 [Aliidiomarina sp.]|uniref:hypothetical protein n=1 Tax=Aliidiomarina sp. TaxID=1872439 RepID=UPI0025C63024|nr:hypothetical protein [Aliidiomarina sp.]MCH8501799.1 hypothetical protein [Aliidiomarina sp.]
MSSLSAADQRLMRLLKISMITGVCLLVLGHIVLSATFLNDNIDHRGYMLGAGMSAIGIILSLPTKIYLTILLMEYEEKNKAEQSDPSESGTGQ